ncbi:putative 5-formyltetrahydrofolate cyclo-ligase [Marinomonas spartinae]|uniref:5-formyltetrahydrofolate cyclo-ligase n=1 Tax=Marinomonas spartinae TaxID=1792290 RepID=A0A1A8TJP8_9GAMM|nr:5-formyltetrahydrofolate cyclo-ligase [Marinomonas spartinae]SBS32492.1 putative 5-formyltetrahydrofolate cyclo-ligase [Marinomonas spartinae]
MPSAVDFRQTLRRQLRQARRHLSTTEQSLAAEALVKAYQGLSSAINISDGKNIALYLTNDGEISPHILCEHLWSLGHNIYLPVVKEQSLDFAHYTQQHLDDDTLWHENRFGIKEPVDVSPISGFEMDLVFLPLVGFDDQGGRLGMGGGFYDRTFANKSEQAKPLLIGLAHDCQQVASLPMESWDIPLDVIMTPTQLISITNHTQTD